MYHLFIGNFERVIGAKAYYKAKSGFVPCRVVGYNFRSRKYTLKTESGETLKSALIYLERG